MRKVVGGCLRHVELNCCPIAAPSTRRRQIGLRLRHRLGASLHARCGSRYPPRRSQPRPLDLLLSTDAFLGVLVTRHLEPELCSGQLASRPFLRIFFPSSFGHVSRLLTALSQRDPARLSPQASSVACWSLHRKWWTPYSTVYIIRAIGTAGT